MSAETQKFDTKYISSQHQEFKTSPLMSYFPHPWKTTTTNQQQQQQQQQQQNPGQVI